MTLLAALVGVLAAAGAFLIYDGLRLRPPAVRTERTVPEIPRERVLRALGAGLVTALLTRWPVAALGMAAVGWFGAELFGSRRTAERATARTEAIAAWTEMLRDTMSGAHGLEEAVTTSAIVAPAPIRREVTALAVRLERQPLDVALRAFATDLAHPTADLVVASLSLASTGAVGDLNDLLGTLALSAREEAGMRLRVAAARARLRTAVRVIAGVTALTALGLIVLNRSYLDSYWTPTGQGVLAVVAVTWGIGLWWLAKMGDFIAPERFLVADAEDRK